MAGKKKTKSGAKGTEGAAQAWNDAAAKANASGANGADEQKKLPLGDEERVRKEIELPTPLAVDAIAMAARRAATAQKTIDRIQADIADHQTAIGELQKEKKKSDGERAKHLREVDTGASWGMVECIEIHNFRVNTVRTYRADPKGKDGLGDLVSERAMTGEERERRVFDPPPDDGPRVEVPAEPAKEPPRVGPQPGEPVH